MFLEYFTFTGKCQKSNRIFKKLFMSVIQNCLHTSETGLLLQIMPLCIGQAELHRFKSSSDISPYSMVLIKAEWLQGNFTVADKSFWFFVATK